MWKKKLYLVKDVLIALLLVISVISPLYAWWISNTLDNFSRGLLGGASLVATVVTVTLFALDFWKVDIAEAEEIALNHLNLKEKHTESIIIRVENVELKDGKWHVSGRWVPKDRVYIVPGSPKLGDPNLGKKFEIVIDSLTSRIIRYSSNYLPSDEAFQIRI